MGWYIRHFTNTQKALDDVAQIVCKEKQEEIEDLRKYIDRIEKEAAELANKHQDLIFTRAHDLFDFLVGL
jgi:hypothetical protein